MTALRQSAITLGQTTRLAIPGLVLKGDETDALGAARPLPDQDQARKLDLLPVSAAPEIGGGDIALFAQALAQEGQGVRLQRKAQRPVVLDDLLADRHDRQGNRWLATLVADGPEQGQIGRVLQRPGLPKRLPAVHVERPESIGRGQPAYRGGAQSGALLQFPEVTVGPVRGGP